MIEKLPLKVTRNGLIPNDGYVAKRILERFKFGDVLLAGLTKLRLPWYNRYAHKIGTLCVNNLTGFESLDAHDALKRLQWEANAWCDEIAAMVPGMGLVPIRIPKSLGYGVCSQENYEKAIVVICNYIAEKYWPDMTAEQIKEMAEIMPDEV